MQTPQTSNMVGRWLDETPAEEGINKMRMKYPIRLGLLPLFRDQTSKKLLNAKPNLNSRSSASDTRKKANICRPINWGRLSVDRRRTSKTLSNLEWRKCFHFDDFFKWLNRIGAVKSYEANSYRKVATSDMSPVIEISIKWHNYCSSSSANKWTKQKWLRTLTIILWRFTSNETLKLCLTKQFYGTRGYTN